MKTSVNNKLIRKARAATIAFVALATLFGSVGLTRPAYAQGQGKVSVHDISFGPATVNPASPDLGLTTESLEVSLLLPAVQKVREAASRMRVSGHGWSVELPVYGDTMPTIAKFKLWVERSTAEQGYVLNIRLQDGEVRRMPIQVNEIAIQVQPATQSDRRIIEVDAASVKHHTVANVLMGDGSVRPILIGLLLPAVQKVR
ncbi:MAG: hypothetical protein K1X67_21320 [Fimbriimonadaceae bacterium]|nr:hypothetical protein [Fimbriimonadaceae bacterium]